MHEIEIDLLTDFLRKETHSRTTKSCLEEWETVYCEPISILIEAGKTKKEIEKILNICQAKK